MDVVKKRSTWILKFEQSEEKNKIINKISVEEMASKFIEEDHPTILIDGRPLDLILNDLFPNELLLGLIPMITDWISLEEETKLVEDVYEANQELKILPILMCPDDCDLSCTLVVAEVETIHDQIKWLRIGIDMNNPKELIEQNRFFETNVKWLNNMSAMTFSKDDYKSLDKIYRKNN